MYSKLRIQVLFILLFSLLFTFKGTYVNAEAEKEVVDIKKEQLISSKIPMPIEHQEFLYNICKERGLDYLKTLAIIKLESNFNPNSNSGVNFGYMQINKMHHEKLSRTLGLENKPLDPYINMNWGTSMLAKLYTKFSNEGYVGDALDRAVWSAYNKGEGGFRRTGEATRYIEKTYSDLGWIKKTLGI